MKPELIADYNCVTGEGPLWHPLERKLYWCDIPQGRLFRYDPATGAHEMCFEYPEAVGGFTVQADGALLLFMARGAIKIWREGELETVVEEIPEERDSRFNDVIADPAGRVFCGTMPARERLGKLYRLDTDGSLRVVVDGVGTSNGMGFAPQAGMPDHWQMYYTDSRAREIYLFDYDQATGELSNRRVFLDLTGEQGVPDGMTVDAAGNVWSARWDGGCLVQYDPQGVERQRIDFPAKKVSSVIFGGPDYTDIYVTTAGGDHKETNGSGAGALFRIRNAGQGVPEFCSRIACK